MSDKNDNPAPKPPPSPPPTPVKVTAGETLSKQVFTELVLDLMIKPS